MTFGSLLLFCFAVIGFTNIIVDPATIARPLRSKVEKLAEGKCCKWFWGWLNKLMDCYQCTGFWVGMFCGIFITSWQFTFYDVVWDLLSLIFIFGMGGSFIATWGATYLSYLEAHSVVAGLDNE